MGYKVSKPFRDDDSPCDKDDSLALLEELALVKQYLGETPLQESCTDDVIVSPSPSPESMNIILIEALNLISSSSSILYIIPSCVHVLDAFLDDIRGYKPSLDPYSLYLEDKPGKIMLTNAINYSIDFFKAFDKVRIALTIIYIFIFMCSCLHSYE